MNQDCSDQTLARLFEQQRDADRRAAPSFSSRREPAAARPAVWLQPRALAAALAVVVGPVLAVVVFRSQTSEWRMRSPDAPAPAVTTIQWRSVTDALLTNYADAAADSMPSLTGAWTDALIPSPAKAEPQQ